MDITKRNSRNSSELLKINCDYDTQDLLLNHNENNIPNDKNHESKDESSKA